MRRWLWLGLLLGLSGVVWAQQEPAQKPPPSSSENPDSASGLSRDNTFPGDRPANSAPANGDAPKKRPPSMEPPRSDRVQVDDLGTGVGESSSKDTQVD